MNIFEFKQWLIDKYNKSKQAAINADTDENKNINKGKMIAYLDMLDQCDILFKQQEYEHISESQ